MTLSDNSLLPTVGQLEREISQKVQSFYFEFLGKRPSKVNVQIFGTKLVLVLEETITKPESILVREGKDDLVEQVREDLDQVLQPQLRELIEQILSVQIIDLLSDSTLESGRIGIIAILDEEPRFRCRKDKPESVSP